MLGKRHMPNVRPEVASFTRARSCVLAGSANMQLHMHGDCRMIKKWRSDLRSMS